MSQPSTTTSKWKEAKLPTRGHWFLVGVTVVAALAIWEWSSWVYSWNQWVFAYAFMGSLGVLLTGFLVPLLHWSIRYRYLGERYRLQFGQYLSGTEAFDITIVVLGIFERLIFATFAFMLVSPTKNGGPLGVEGELGVLGTFAAGWLVLNSLAGWRRVTADSAIVRSMTMSAILGTFVSIVFGIVSGVLGQTLFD